MALIYIVEDDENVREVEEFSLKNSGYRVESFSGSRKFFKRLDEKVPELIILDIVLPGEDGFQIINKLKNTKSFRTIPILVVSEKSLNIKKIGEYDVGSFDYISKPFSVMELISKVKALMYRVTVSEESKTFAMGDIIMDNEVQKVYVKKSPVVLTCKEYQLLKLLMINASKVVSRDYIMSKVWKVELESQSRTLDMHIGSLRKKLGDSGKMIRTIRNVGYCMEDIIK